MSLTDQVQLIFGLTGIGIGSLAFIAGLYAFVSSHTRLQESAYGILTTTFFFSLSTTFLIIALILTISGAKPAGLMFAIGGLVIFVLGWLILFISFFRLYGRVSHMRDRRFLRYVPIFSLINSLRMKELSSLNVAVRSSFNLGPYSFSEKELETITRGYSFLFIGPRFLTFQLMAIDILVDGLKNGETANYVCCDRPPYQVWEWFKQRDPIPSNRYLMFIDAFTPHLGYSDKILKSANKEVEQDGVTIIPAKGMAGIHSALDTALFDKTAELARLRGTGQRMPNRMLYDNLSALSSLSSSDLVRSFSQHVIAADRKYGMISIFVEYEDANQEVISAIKSTVDAIIIFSWSSTNAQVEVEAKKMTGINLGKYYDKKPWVSQRDFDDTASRKAKTDLKPNKPHQT